MRMLALVTTSVLITLIGCVDPATDDGAAKLAAFELLPRSSAIAQYETLPAAAKVVLWRAQLDRVLAERALTPAQTDAVRGVRGQLDSLMSSPSAMTAAYAQVQAVMTDAEIDDLLGELGDPHRRSPRVLYNAALDCDTRWNCASGCICGQDWSGTLPGPNNDCFNYTCASTCSATSSGCGFLWSQSCNKTELKGSACST